MRRNLLTLILVLVNALTAFAQSYNGIYITASGSFDATSKSVEMHIQRIDVIDSKGKLMSSATIDKFDIYRTEAHGAPKLMTTLSTPVQVVDGVPDTSVSWTDTSLPETTTSTFVSYTIYAYIGNYRSQGSMVTNSSSTTTAENFVIDYRRYPSAVSDLVVVPAEDFSKATVRFVAPSTYTNGDKLSSFSSIVLSKYNYSTYSYSTLKTYSGLVTKPGATVEYVDEDVKEGESLWYKVVVYTGSGSNTLVSEEKTVTCVLGDDVPNPVTGLRAESDDSAVRLSWTAPTGGLYGGSVNPSRLTYRIERSVDGANAKTLAEVVGVTEYVDQDLMPNYTNYIYNVIAVNTKGQSNYTSVSVSAGAPYELPFSETVSSNGVAGKGFDNTGWSASSNGSNSYGGWMPSSSILNNDAYSYIYGTGGMATLSLYPNNVHRWNDYLTSPAILTGGNANLTVSFDCYVMPSYDNVIAVEVAVDGDDDFKEIGRVTYDSAESTGWKTYEFTAAGALDGATTFKVRFNSYKGAHSNSVGIDTILISADGATAVGNVNENRDKNSARYTLSGVRQTGTPVKGIILQNGRKAIVR